MEAGEWFSSSKLNGPILTMKLTEERPVPTAPPSTASGSDSNTHYVSKDDIGGNAAPYVAGGNTSPYAAAGAPTPYVPSALGR